jgi:hypothetical protein
MSAVAIVEALVVRCVAEVPHVSGGPEAFDTGNEAEGTISGRAAVFVDPAVSAQADVGQTVIRLDVATNSARACLFTAALVVLGTPRNGVPVVAAFRTTVAAWWRR